MLVFQFYLTANLIFLFDSLIQAMEDLKQFYLDLITFS